MVLPIKLKHSRFSLALAVCLIAMLVCSFVGSVSASSTTYYNLDSWDIQSVWRGVHFNATSTYTFTCNFGGVRLTNASNLGKFCFSIIDDTNTGYTYEIYPGAGASANYLYKDNTVYFKSLTSGVEALLFTSSDVNSSSVKIVNDGSIVELWLNGVKKYQNTVIDYDATQIQYFTANVPLTLGDITQPSCFTGRFSVSMLNAVSSGSSSIDVGQISDVTASMIALFVAIIPLSVYMAVFKIIPRMMRGIKF